MIKRTLPIYQTGWLYLILLFWLAIYCYVSNGGLNPANQVNLTLLEKITPDRALLNKERTLSDADILTLHSSFEEYDTSAISTLLSQQKNSHIVFLGRQSKSFITKLNKYLTTKPRKNKIIIDSHYAVSKAPVKINDAMLFSGGLNWLRFTEAESTRLINSKHFIFSPFLLNKRQSFPMVWQLEDELQLSLLGEVLQQLNTSNNLMLDQQWHLGLINFPNTFGPKEISLGFFGEVFSAGNAYNLDRHGFQKAYLKNNHLVSDYFLDNKKYEKQSLELDKVNTDEQNSQKLLTVKQFIKQQSHSKESSKAQYKVIILTDEILQNDEIIKPLLIKLSQGDYLSQNVFTLMLCALIVIIGLALVWLLQKLTFNQQLTSILLYFLILLTLQALMFSQQQWLEILPSLILISGTWALFYAYHKEDYLFATALMRQAEKLKSSTTAATVIANTRATNKRKQNYKSPQNFSPTAPLAETTTEDLDKTLLIGTATAQKQAKTNHHITVENFGRYQVEGILGKGAMGIVYQGVDPKINRHVAIKTLQLGSDLEPKEQAEAKDRFFREAQTAGGLSHANIVTIYDVGEENNLGYIAMDLLTGAPLSVFTQEGQTLPVPLIYQLLIQITDALDYAHKQNVVHRDIKPANIIYDDDLLKVTVTDFGIAYVSDHSKTRTGVIMGSPYYMSPEQILGLKVDGRSDIFSLGVTFYQLLSGHLPFEGESIATVAYQITKAKPIAITQHNANLPASAQRIINKAMHKDIDKRYQSMSEFKLALNNALKRDFKITAN